MHEVSDQTVSGDLLHVVALSPYVPYPGIDHAGGSFLNAYLTAVSPYMRVTLFAPADETNSAHAEESPVPVRLVPLGRRSSRAVSKANSVIRAPTPGRDLVRAFTTDVDVQSSVRTADVVELHWGYLLALVPWLRHQRPIGPIAVHGHDVIGQSESRRAATHTVPLLREAYAMHARRTARREASYLNDCDIAYYFSHIDLQLLRSTGVRTPLRVLDPDLRLPDNEPQPEADGPPRVLFVGALHRRENSDGVRWFLSNVWPQVRSRVPGAQFVVAGANPPPDLSSAEAADIEVTGYVPDLTPYYAKATVFVAPLLTGAGLKFKVAQAMLFGLPIVATEIGAEGYLGTPGDEVFAAVTNDAGAMADAVSRLLLDGALRRKYGERARVFGRSQFDFHAKVAAVREDYLRLRTETRSG